MLDVFRPVFWLFSPSGGGERRARGNETAKQRSASPWSSEHVADDTDDRAILANLAAADERVAERALGDLVTRYGAAVRRTAAMFLGDWDAADDIVQDIFVALWQQRATRSVHGNIAGYLHRAARNRALNVRRALGARERAYQRIMQCSENTVDVSSDATDTPVEASRYATQIKDALATMRPRVREIFLLHRIQGMRAPEIAALLGISVATVHQQLSRGIAHLAHHLTGRTASD